MFVDKDNAIHYENFSIALADSVISSGQNFLTNMAFGNGGTSVDPTGIITYLTPNTTGTNSGLYNQTYTQVVNQQSVSNINPLTNNINVVHVSGTNYSDLQITCTLDYSQPVDQSAFDTSTYTNGMYVFDELGLVSSNGMLLSHVIFHPVQKALNRRMRIYYTVRIMAITGS